MIVTCKNEKGVKGIDMLEPPATPEKSTKKICIWVAVVFTICLVLSGVIVASIFIGRNMSSDDSKESWVVFYRENEQPLTEKFTVTSTELDVWGPGTFRIIYDFERRQTVTQIVVNGGEVMCLVSDFVEEEEDINIDDIRNEMTGAHINRTIENVREHLTITVMRDEFDRAFLSPRAREMCFGVPVLKVEKNLIDNADGTERMTRSFCITFDFCVWFVCFKDIKICF